MVSLFQSGHGVHSVLESPQAQGNMLGAHVLREEACAGSDCLGELYIASS